MCFGGRFLLRLSVAALNLGTVLVNQSLCVLMKAPMALTAMQSVAMLPDHTGSQIDIFGCCFQRWLFWSSGHSVAPALRLVFGSGLTLVHFWRSESRPGWVGALAVANRCRVSARLLAGSCLDFSFGCKVCTGQLLVPCEKI